ATRACGSWQPVDGHRTLKPFELDHLSLRNQLPLPEPLAHPAVSLLTQNDISRSGRSLQSGGEVGDIADGAQVGALRQLTHDRGADRDAQAHRKPAGHGFVSHREAGLEGLEAMI